MEYDSSIFFRNESINYILLSNREILFDYNARTQISTFLGEIENKQSRVCLLIMINISIRTRSRSGIIPLPLI